MFASAPARSWGSSGGALQTIAKTPSSRPSVECLVGNRGLPVGGPWFPPVAVCACGGMSPRCLCKCCLALATSPTFTLRNVASAHRSIVSSVGIRLWEPATECFQESHVSLALRAPQQQEGNAFHTRICPDDRQRQLHRAVLAIPLGKHCGTP